MLRGGGFPYFLWEEYNENWDTLSFVEISALNKAAAKDQKRLTLPTSGPRKKSTIYFEKMISKNDESGEKPIRCAILNNKFVYAIWSSNKNSENNFISFTPRMTYFLELMYQKKVRKVDFYYKTEYEVDFSQLVMRDKKSEILYSIQREEIEIIYPSQNDAEMKRHVHSINSSKFLMEKVSVYSVNRIKNLLFNIPITGTEVASSTTVPFTSWISILDKGALSKDGALMAMDPEIDSDKCSVVSENGYSFSATLVLTKLEENINKFCILQLLRIKKKKQYVVYTRSGRVGYIGSTDFSERFSYLNDAKEHFKDRFYKMTRNIWSERHNFQKKFNKYDLIHTFYNEENTDSCFEVPLENIISTLDKMFQELLLLLVGTDKTDLKLVIRKWLLKFMSTKIGIPTAKQLVKSFRALKEVSDLLSERNKGKDLVAACNNYYMKIPHAYPKNNAPKTILCAETVEDEALMLKTMAYAILSRSEGSLSLENPIEVYFRKLQWHIACLDRQSPEFTVLHQSLLGLHGPSHIYKIELLDAYKWHKQAEEERFTDKGNKMLLWHGTQLHNFLGIIENGLTLPPVDAQNNSMFGRGLYFADVSSKSANYCVPIRENDIRLLLLCEVSMGQPLEVFHGTDFSSRPSLFGSVHALGEYYPSSFTESILAPDTVIPKGPLKRRNNKDLSLLYNEYVIYDERQVKIKFLLKIKFSNV